MRLLRSRWGGLALAEAALDRAGLGSCRRVPRADARGYEYAALRALQAVQLQQPSKPQTTLEEEKQMEEILRTMLGRLLGRASE